MLSLLFFGTSVLAESDHPQNLLKTGLGVRGVAGVAVLTSEILAFFISNNSRDISIHYNM